MPVLCVHDSKRTLISVLTGTPQDLFSLLPSRHGITRLDDRSESLSLDTAEPSLNVVPKCIGYVRREIVRESQEPSVETQDGPGVRRVEPELECACENDGGGGR